MPSCLPRLCQVLSFDETAQRGVYGTAGMQELNMLATRLLIASGILAVGSILYDLHRK